MRARTIRRLALEVSSSAVRIAEVSVAGSRPRLLNVAQVRLPARAVVDGVVSDQSAVVAAIQRCMKEGGFSGKEVHLGIAALRAITREIEMPAVPESELDEAARLQVLDVVPFPADKTLLSARPLEEPHETEAGTATLRVLLAAAHREVVDPLLEAVEKAGLVAVSVELSSLALLRALGSRTGEKGAEAIVSIGAGLTLIVIHEGGIPRFVRTVALGGDHVTAAIAGALDVPSEDAELMKRSLDQSGPHLRAAAAGAHGTILQLVSEVQSSVDYYATLPDKSPVGRIQLTGGGSLLPGFAERLSQQVSAEVVPARALDHLGLGSLRLDEDERTRREPIVATVVGLAMGDPAGVKPLNLLPPEIGLARRYKRIERDVIAVSAAAVLALAGLGVLSYTRVQNAEAVVSGLDQNARAMQAAISRQEGHAKTYNAISADEAAVSPILSTEVDWPRVFSDLARDTPAGGVVTSISGSYVAPAAPASPAAGSGTPVAGAPPVSSPAARSATTIANLSVTISTNQGYSYFRQWLQAMSTSPQFRYVSFSGLSAGKANTVTWSAELAVLGTIRSGRASEFEVTSR